jgi:hypothetical protein
MKFRRRPEIVEAIQYVEIGRQSAKYGEIVTRNGPQVAAFLGAGMYHESTFPNGHPEGRSVLIFRLALGRPAVEIGLGEWVVLSEVAGPQVYSAEEFAQLFEEQLDPCSRAGS